MPQWLICGLNFTHAIRYLTSLPGMVRVSNPYLTPKCWRSQPSSSPRCWDWKANINQATQAVVEEGQTMVPKKLSIWEMWRNVNARCCLLSVPLCLGHYMEWMAMNKSMQIPENKMSCIYKAALSKGEEGKMKEIAVQARFVVMCSGISSVTKEEWNCHTY